MVNLTDQILTHEIYWLTLEIFEFLAPFYLFSFYHDPFCRFKGLEVWRLLLQIVFICEHSLEKVK